MRACVCKCLYWCEWVCTCECMGVEAGGPSCTSCKTSSTEQQRTHHAFCRVRACFVVAVENPEFCLEYVNFKVPMTCVSCVQTGRHVTCALVTF